MVGGLVVRVAGWQVGWQIGRFRLAGLNINSLAGGQMDTIPQDRSHLRGTGPSSYGTGPILFNKIEPVPNWDIFMNKYRVFQKKV